MKFEQVRQRAKNAKRDDIEGQTYWAQRRVFGFPIRKSNRVSKAERKEKGKFGVIKQVKGPYQLICISQ